MCSFLFNKAQDILIRAGVLFNPSPFTVAEVRNVKFLSVKEGVEASMVSGGRAGGVHWPETQMSQIERAHYSYPMNWKI